MEHKWTSYHGFTESFEYCEHCDQRKGQHDYNCRQVGSERVATSTWNYLNLLEPNLEDDKVQLAFAGGASSEEWDKYYTLSAHDDVTQLELEDGRIATPMEMYRDSFFGYTDFPTGTKFKFKRIRTSWRDGKGLTADEYYDDSAPISPPIGTIHPRIGFGNSNAGNQTGTQHGQQSSSGLGAVSHTLAHGTVLAEQLTEATGWLLRHHYDRLIWDDNDSED
jgi:hypothetical protein